MPGPGSTQLAIFCAWRLRGVPGALVGGAGFILPGLAAILALSALFLASAPPSWVIGAGAGAGAGVAAIAVRAGIGLLPSSWERARGTHPLRWVLYGIAGIAATALVGAWLVLVLIACGLVELLLRRPGTAGGALGSLAFVPLATEGAGIGALAWVAFKVGALSYGGGFVIVPLMQADAVSHYHWMTSGQFLNAVALGQMTPGPVTHTVAVVGYAAAGIWGALLASAVAFAPSFSFILIGAERFDRLRSDLRARAFLDGAGPAAIGAIFGSAIPLALALSETWQVVVLALAAVALLIFRRSVVTTLLIAALIGVAIALAGGPLPEQSSGSRHQPGISVRLPRAIHCSLFAETARASPFSRHARGLAAFSFDSIETGDMSQGRLLGGVTSASAGIPFHDPEAGLQAGTAGQPSRSGPWCFACLTLVKGAADNATTERTQLKRPLRA